MPSANHGRVDLAGAGESSNECTHCHSKFEAGQAIRVMALGIWIRGAVRDLHGYRLAHVVCPGSDS